MMGAVQSVPRDEGACSLYVILCALGACSVCVCPLEKRTSESQAHFCLSESTLLINFSFFTHHMNDTRAIHTYIDMVTSIRANSFPSLAKEKKNLPLVHQNMLPCHLFHMSTTNLTSLSLTFLPRLAGATTSTHTIKQLPPPNTQTSRPVGSRFFFLFEILVSFRFASHPSHCSHGAQEPYLRTN